MMPKPHYTRTVLLTEFNRRLKRWSVENGYPTMIAAQRALLEEDEPFRKIVRTTKNTNRGKDDFII